MRNDNELPKGLEFLQYAWDLEDQCQAETDSRLADTWDRGRSRLNAIGTVLEYLQQMGSCFWGCSDKEYRS